MSTNKDFIMLNKTLECDLGRPLKDAHLNIKCTISEPNKVSGNHIFTDVAPTFTAVIAFLMMLITARKYSKDFNLQLDSIKRDKKNSFREGELEKIEKFYGPMKALREESFVLYQYFAIEEKLQLEGNGKGFRTLRYLTESSATGEIGMKKFSSHDQSILKSILEISDKNLKLIEEHGGYVDNPDLHALLGRLAAHFRTLKLAADGQLIGMSEKLESIVFPREIDGAIDNEIRKIQASIKKYHSNKKYHPKSKSIKYYDNNAQEYSLKTLNIDMTHSYDKFLHYLPMGAKILDAGCGVGRDTKYFIKNAYRVTSFDASKMMAETCNQYPFAYCEILEFSEINYGPYFDGVWACASLLHLDITDFEQALVKLWRSLKTGGHFYFSLKKIEHDKQSSREYFYYSDDCIKRLLINNLKMTYKESWQSTSTISNNEVFTNYIFMK